MNRWTQVWAVVAAAAAVPPGPSDRATRPGPVREQAHPVPGGTGSIRRRWTFGARRQHWGTRVRTVALRHHRHRPRRTAVRRPQQRHGVARRHQRYHLDDASALRIDDHPDFFAGGIDRTQRVGRALAHRATHRLEAGRAHDRHDLMRRQSRAGIDGTGINGRWRGLRQCVSGYRERGDKSRAEGDLVLQDKVPPIWLSPVRCLGRRDSANAMRLKRNRSRLGGACRNDSKELGVALALPCHQEARATATNRSTSSAVVANEVTRRTRVVSRAGTAPSGSASVVQG